MIQNFESEQALIQWVEQRLRETQSTRQDRAVYANRCRAYYNGNHWISRGTGPESFNRLYYTNQGSWHETYESNEPMKVTINQITNAVLASAAKTNWMSMEVHSLPGFTSSSPDSVVDADILETIANIAVDMSGLKDAAEIAGFERCIDAMHGVGIRIERSGVSGPDVCLQAFDFDGYQLALDPLVKTHDLSRHPYVIYTEVLTLHAAKREFPEAMANIDEKKLQTVAQIMPTEIAFYGLSGGRLYTHLHEVADQPALRRHWVILRGPYKRFDRIYHVIDGMGDAGKTVINFDNPANPYGGCGMPLMIKSGFRRPSEVFSISDVGMMIDEQDRLNAMATLFYQQVWDYTTRYVTVIDKGAFGTKRIGENEIIEMLRSPYWFMHTTGSQRFMPPTMMGRPAPDQGLQISMEGQKSAIRSSAFQSDLHAGQVKTHVADRTNQMSLELVEAPIDDRRDEDVRMMNTLVEVAAGTLIRAARVGAPSVLQALQDAGMNETQIGRVVGSIDPVRLPARLQINRESVRRRSRGQQKRDMIEMAQYGAHKDPVLRRALAQIDYPFMDEDKSVERWADQAVANLIAGDMWDAIPFGSSAEVVFAALRRGMMSDAAKDPAVMDRLREAFASQMEVEGMMQPQEPQPAQAAPAEATLDDVFGPVQVN